jgi:general secretion pathway protein G
MGSNAARGPRAGFTLIELLVVILIFAVLAGAVVPRMTSHLAEKRDARRLTDASVIREAIEQHYLDKGFYPAAISDSAADGWDASNLGAFIPDLVASGYLRKEPRDPVNDAEHNYRYMVYDSGIGGCQGKGKFYVLGITAFESPDFDKKNPGYFKCADRDWSKDFAFVTGGGATQKK